MADKPKPCETDGEVDRWYVDDQINRAIAEAELEAQQADRDQQLWDEANHQGRL